ncbi:MAG: hypothetical protein M1837_003457 [Sclerophora amabilis]|nr:MAG: hypothetical protein M1837_003457 [Sclerophora amabilis]
MTLEDFEKSLSEKNASKGARNRSRGEEKDRRSGRHHHRSHHKSSGHRETNAHPRKQKRPRESGDEAADSGGRRKRKHTESPVGNSTLGIDDEEDEWVEQDAKPTLSQVEGHDYHRTASDPDLKRDSWMQAPSALDIDYVQKASKRSMDRSQGRFTRSNDELDNHENETFHHTERRDEGEDAALVVNEPAQHDVDYSFGDIGSKWRMTRLKAVYTQAKETGRSVDDLASERFGDLRAFDDAREEQIELDRRATYGHGYVGKERPSGELFQERKLNMGVKRSDGHENDSKNEDLPAQGTVVASEPASVQTALLDQTALNRLKAQLMKAKLQGSSDLARVEAEYNAAMSSYANRKEPDVIVLGAMNNRMLAGGRQGEVKPVETTRGRERGLVEQNEDMTIEDMVREERRTKGQAGGEGRQFAERIAKDGKFDNDLDYMDENANKLAKRVQKSEVNLKSTAIGDFQKMNRILDSCPLCHHEDTNKPPVAPIVSLATRSYLTLPTEPEISDGGAMVIPVQHRNNLLECDDDEWEEIRNFMKSLTRMYHDQGRDVLFYENAAAPERKKHAALQAVPLPYSLGGTAPAFFKEAMLSSDEEWSQHKKIIDTLARARSHGLGKLAFRRSLVKEMPYFHVWFELDGGLGHIVEDSNRWPKGDLFAREIIGGMLDADPRVVRQQGRWSRGGDRRTDDFRKRWKKFDWTRILTDT